MLARTFSISNPVLIRGSKLDECLTGEYTVCVARYVSFLALSIITKDLPRKSFDITLCKT